MGIKETKELLLFLVEIFVVVIEVTRSPRSAFMRLGSFLSAVNKASDAIDGIDAVDDELIDMDEDEKKELNELIRITLHLDDVSPEAEGLTEEGIMLAVSAASFFLKLKKLIQTKPQHFRIDK